MPGLAIIPEEEEREPSGEPIMAALGLVGGRDMLPAPGAAGRDGRAMPCAAANGGARAEAATAPQAKSSERACRMCMIRPSTVIHQVDLQNATHACGT